MIKCTTCEDKKANFKLWQMSKNKYENFCGNDCLKIYCHKTYKRLGTRAFGLAQEFVEPLEEKIK